jgi:hypothetical protein
MRTLLLTVMVVSGLGGCDSTKACYPVPSHCACGGDPACEDGEWVCHCAPDLSVAQDLSHHD